MLLKNFGITRSGRVVFYDYDELCLLTDCRLPRAARARRRRRARPARPRSTSGPRDIFPQEFINFLGFPRPLRELFVRVHGDLLEPAWWNRMKERHRRGEILDICPYRPARRLHGRLPRQRYRLPRGRAETPRRARPTQGCRATRMPRAGGQPWLMRRSSSPPTARRSTSTAASSIVPDHPIIPFIEGDGTGADIWRASVRVFDAAVEKAYGGKSRIAWMEVYAGEKAFNNFGSWLPDETVEAFHEYLVGIKGPLTTPIGGGIRSLNVALRQMLDLYVCLRPVRWFKGVPSPVQAPRQGRHGHLPREHRGHLRRHRVRGRQRRREEGARLPQGHVPQDVQEDPLPGRRRASASSRSPQGTAPSLVRAAIEYAIANKRKSVTLVHKGNIMKFTEGAFRNWGYALAESEFGDQIYTWDQWERTKAAKGEAAGQRRAEGGARRPASVLIKDAIADITLQQVLTRPDEFDVIATLNLNGDYLSDALAAQVGGIGIAPGGNINYVTGHAIFEATHGTAPKYADLDKVNPGSVILSGEMMLRHMGWTEAADLIIKGMDGAIAAKTVTYDFARLMEGAKEVKCSEFGTATNLGAHASCRPWSVRARRRAN